MAPVSLSKLIKKRALTPLFYRLVSDLETSVVIEDAEGKTPDGYRRRRAVYAVSGDCYR